MKGTQSDATTIAVTIIDIVVFSWTYSSVGMVFGCCGCCLVCGRSKVEAEAVGARLASVPVDPGR